KLTIIDNGILSHSFTNRDFQNTKVYQGNIIATPKFNTSTSGILSVKFKLLNSKTNQLLSKGKFRLDLKKDWMYGVYFRIDSVNVNPTKYCMGCGKYFSFKINQTLIDSTSIL